MPRRSAVAARRGRVLAATVLVLLAGALVASRNAAAFAGAVPVVASPAPGSRTAFPQTQISLLGAPIRALGTVRVTGSRSGRHAGRLAAYSNGDGASFLPNKPFLPGETVTVTTKASIAGAPGGTFRFTVATPAPISARPAIHAVHTTVPGVQHFVSAPELAPPTVTVTHLAAGRAPGDYVLAPKGSVAQSGPMIVDGAGRLVYFRPLAGAEAFDASVQTYRNKPVLAWFQGGVLLGHGVGEVVLVDNAYRTVATVHAGNGLAADLHDFQLTGAGSALLSAYAPTRWNLRPDGGAAAGTVWDGVVQEVDVATGLVMYQWDSLDHVPVTASYFKAPTNPATPFDYFHVNSIDPQPGGDLVVSARNTSAVYDVSVSDAGAVRWVLGGHASTFAMGPKTTFNFQHDVRLFPNGTMTIFDNEASPARAPQSRALTLALDFANRRATFLRALTHSPPVLGVALGNVQVLSGGRTAVGWGTSPYFSQYGPAGQVLFDARLPTGDDSYRAFLAHWVGRPTAPPALALRPAGTGALSAYVSWNGATGVARWQLLAGSGPSALHLVATARATGFETRIALPHAQYLEAVARAASGAVLGHSPVQKAP